MPPSPHRTGDGRGRDGRLVDHVGGVRFPLDGHVHRLGLHLVRAEPEDAHVDGVQEHGDKHQPVGEDRSVKAVICGLVGAHRSVKAVICDGGSTQSCRNGS